MNPNQFPLIEELQNMSLDALKNVYISNADQEQIIQEIVNSRVRVAPPVDKVYRGDVPFQIKTIEEEKHWQKIIDERTAALQARMNPVEAVEAKPVESVEILTPEVQEPIKVSVKKIKK